MIFSKKGLKMNISKLFRSYKIEQSKDFATEVWGQRDYTNGYRMIDSDDEKTVSLIWHDDDMETSEKLEKLVMMFDLLNKHGYDEYIELDKENLQITINNYSL